MRVAWSRNLGDLPVDPEVTAALERRRAALEAMGCVVEEIEPDLTAADEAFEVLRASATRTPSATCSATSEELKDTVVWKPASASRSPARASGGPWALQTEMFHRMRRAAGGLRRARAAGRARSRHFPVEQRMGRRDRRGDDGLLPRVDALVLADHGDGAPALSIPAGFTPEGLPVGLQLVGRHRGELDLLRLAAGIERPPAPGSARLSCDRRS